MQNPLHLRWKDRTDGLSGEMRKTSPRARGVNNGNGPVTAWIRASLSGRSGWTLIELLVTLSIMGTITGIAVKTLGTLLRSERTGVDHVSQLVAVSQLSRQFRADVHAATTAEIGTDVPTKPLLRIAIGADRQIQYEKQPEGLLRTEQRPHKTPIRHLWRLKQTEFQCVETTGPPRLLTLVIGTLEAIPAKMGTPTVAKELRIDAIIGRDRP